LWSSVLS